MKSVLARKVLRDILQAKGQYLSILLMVAMGSGFLIGAYSVYQNLAASYARSYQVLDFEDFSIRFESAPERVTDWVAEVPGVVAAEGRLAEETALEIEGKEDAKLYGRLIGMPATRELRVNRLKLTKGRAMRRGAHEILLEAAFAKHHEILPGATVTAVRGSSRLPLRVAGIVQSDEYLYVVRSKQELIAMPDVFGVAFIEEDVLGALFRRGGQINEVHVRVKGPEVLASAMAGAKRVLSAYEPEEPVPREDQPSYQMLQQDVEGFQSYAVLFPLLFLGAAAVSVYSMLSRVVYARRPEIGMLRSIGLSRGQIVRHYLSGTLTVGAAGSLLGIWLGISLGKSLSVFYLSQVQVPFPDLSVRAPVLFVGFFVGTGTGLLAGLLPSLAASRISPAEAMRPAIPSFGRGSVRLDALIPRLSLLGRIPLRNVFRQPRRTISTLAGVVSGMCLMVTASGLQDSMRIAIDQMMAQSFGYDVRVDFYERVSRRTVESVRTWPGVVWAEGILELPMEFRHGNLTYSAVLNGLEEGSRLRPIRNAAGDPMTPSRGGAIFGPTLRKRLDLETGDWVEVWLPEYLTKEDSSRRKIRVAGFCEEMIGTQAYLLRGDLESLFRDDLDLPGNAVSGILLKTAAGDAERIRARTLDLPRAASALSMARMRSMTQKLMETSARFILIMEALGAALAFAVIFNMATVNVLERESEVATLRTLGVSHGEITRMIVAENLAVAALGVVAGLPISRAFVRFFWNVAQTEQQQDLFNIDVAVLPATYWTAAIAILAATLLSLPPSLAHLRRLNLARAVKARSH